MKASFLFIGIGLFLFSNNYIDAQGTEEEKTLSLDKSPIEDQFQYIHKKSSTYEDYRVIRSWHFNQLRAHVLDTLKEKQSQIIKARNEISQKDTRIDSLIAANEQTHADLDRAVMERDALMLLGIPVQKTAYNSIVWSIIGILTASLLVFIFLFRRSYGVIAQTRKDLEDIKTQFEAFRKRALEREEGIVRKYHNELMQYKSKVDK